MTTPSAAVYEYSVATADAQLALAAAAVRSGALGAVGGSLVPELERTMAAHLGRREALAVASATTGLQLLMRALGAGPGSEVVLPELAWVSVGAAAAATGATVRVAPITAALAPGWEQIAPLLGSHTALVVIAHLRGRAAPDTAHIAAELFARGVPLVEDCAQAWRARLPDGRPAGTAGAAAVFSMDRYKVISTGEGGIIAVDDTELTTRMRLLGGLAWVPAHPPEWRGNARMSEPTAALALPQLRQLDHLVSQLRPLQHQVAHVMAAAKGLHEVTPADDNSNGCLVGGWADDPDRAKILTGALFHAGFRAWWPGPDDLHHAANWPVTIDQPLVDVHRYVDVQIPLLPYDQHTAFSDTLHTVLAHWHAGTFTSTSRPR